MKCNVAVIGGGPAGYVAAIRAAQLGASVVLVEDGNLGGTCLNVGCIPTKTMLKSVECFKEAKKFIKLGINVDNVSLDIHAIHKRKDKIIKTLIDGIKHLIKKNKIHFIRGKGTIEDKNVIKITGEKEQVVQADKIIIATGAKPIEIPKFMFDHEHILDSTDILQLQDPPKSLLIIGGGVIALEFASIFSALGTKVIIAEMLDQLLPNEDSDIVEPLHKQLNNDGVEVLTRTKAIGYEKASEDVVVTLDVNEKRQERNVEKILVAVGRTPNLSAVKPIENQLIITNGKIDVNEKMETSIPDIYAVGDVIGGYQLAHVAFQEGTIAAENACGVYNSWDGRAVPRCIYTIPEIACVGMTEKQAKELNGDVNVSVFPYQANGKALIDGSKDGMMKIISHSGSGEILGGAVVGSKASEQIAQIVASIHMMASIEDMELMISAHPTVSEGFKEAILGASGKAIHI
ncbi:dihydrolipoyl dehydrogenase [Cytobacillus purgationiresistens]|uniref:Dihydrolipoyl dehydrogenase n=1 Tax=Cytobacillus purgationiresistens TaxID=863449 RepID=A0ABU0AMV1_9BACI|nr:dihydrolipoyl dehydrogenase [Cytobacillus purgationiresistens]MDQ0272355.1 dihydrolipoamide dehydrogenase [Cytobacillus purgationiresistens]